MLQSLEGARKARDLYQVQLAQERQEWKAFENLGKRIETDLRDQLAQVTQERERKLVQVLDDFRSRNIRRFDLIEALWKAELITKEHP